MPITKLQIKPGLVRDTTSYANEGGWFYSDKIRFRSGSPESIGGWVRLNTDPYVGVCTALQAWVTLGGVSHLAVGTNKKYYVEDGSILFDITPIRVTTAAGDVTFAATNGSTTITATDVGHGALIGDYVTFSGAASLGGNITAGVLNREYVITSVPSVDTYTFTATATANGADVGAGGAATVGAYQVNVGLSVYVAGIGWGSGGYGSAAWGGSSSASVNQQLRLWTQAFFGEDHIFCSRNGGMFYWDASVGTSSRAVKLESMGGASDVPTVSVGVLVTDSKHVVALGANPVGSATQDPLFVRWSDTENAVDWTPTAVNSAGGQRLPLGSSIIAGHNARLETLIWTDVALYAMTFVGGDLIFGFNLLATPITIIGPNAVGIVGGTAFWMGVKKFYMYNGSVSPLPCPVLHLLQENMNYAQSYQTFAAVNEQFSEVTWFYCSTNSDTVDSYITYNYGENIWYFGTMGRSAWVDSGLREYPIAADNTNSVLLYHEYGTDDNSTSTPAAITSYIESSDVDLGDGHQFMFISRIIPDLTFVGSTINNPAVTITLKTRGTPGNTWNSSSNQPTSSTITRTASFGVNTSPFEEYTPQAWVRARGRQASVRVENTSLGVKWQLGALRLDIRPDGRR